MLDVITFPNTNDSGLIYNELYYTKYKIMNKKLIYNEFGRKFCII